MRFDERANNQLLPVGPYHLRWTLANEILKNIFSHDSHSNGINNEVALLIFIIFIIMRFLEFLDFLLNDRLII